MEIFAHDDVVRLLSMSACIDLMEEVLLDVSAETVDLPLRSVTPFGERRFFAQMPSWLPRQGVVGTKVITVVPENRERGIPSHQGMILLFSAVDGMPLAAVDAESVTAIRTAAASGAATRALARPDARVLAVLGTGQQARTHLEAMLAVRPIRQVFVWGPHAERVRQYQQEMAAQYPVPITMAGTPSEAVRQADVICTVTSTVTPLLFADDVKPGTHINAVGACRADERELDGPLVAKARLYVDRRDSADHEAGDYLIPLSEGLIGKGHIVGEIGDVFRERIRGRGHGDEITLFKSVGIAPEDIAAAHYLYERRTAR